MFVFRKLTCFSGNTPVSEEIRVFNGNLNHIRGNPFVQGEMAIFSGKLLFLQEINELSRQKLFPKENDFSQNKVQWLNRKPLNDTFVIGCVSSVSFLFLKAAKRNDDSPATMWTCHDTDRSGRSRNSETRDVDTTAEKCCFIIGMGHHGFVRATRSDLWHQEQDDT